MRGRDDTVKQLMATARRQDGVVSSDHLRTLGVSRDAMSTMVDRGEFDRWYRGVYHAAAVSPTDSSRLRAAWLAVGPGRGAAAGLVSSAHRQGLLEYAPAKPQVVRPGTQGVVQRPGFVVHRFPDLTAAHCITVDGVRCTNPERTIADLAYAAAGDRRMERLVRAALRAAVKSDEGVAERVQELDQARGPRKGRRLLRRLLDELPGTVVVRSLAEISFVGFCSDHGLTLPETNQMISGFEVDAVWRRARLIVEIDTSAHHRDALAFERDRERDAALSVGGWIVVRITADRLHRQPVVVAEQLRSLLSARSL